MHFSKFITIFHTPSPIQTIPTSYCSTHSSTQSLKTKAPHHNISVDTIPHRSSLKCTRFQSGLSFLSIHLSRWKCNYSHVFLASHKNNLEAFFFIKCFLTNFSFFWGGGSFLSGRWVGSLTVEEFSPHCVQRSR